jgi:hypothetical protein
MSGGGRPSPWAGQPITAGFMTPKLEVQFSYLVDMIDSLSDTVMSKIAIIRSKNSAMSIADMFDLQMAMQKLSQFSELSTSVISAFSTEIMSMARNMKG